MPVFGRIGMCGCISIKIRVFRQDRNTRISYPWLYQCGLHIHAAVDLNNLAGNIA